MTVHIEVLLKPFHWYTHYFSFIFKGLSPLIQPTGKYTLESKEVKYYIQHFKS